MSIAPGARQAALALAAIGLALGAGGCSGDGSADDAPASPSTEDAPLPDAIPVTGAERVELDDRLVREIAVPDGPDWMVGAFGSLWVKRDNGSVDRVDPETGKVLAEISSGPFKPPVCQGIGASEDEIWACPRQGELTPIDPASGKVSGTVKLDKVTDQGRLVGAAGKLWVITDSGKTLSAIDERGKPTTVLKLPGCTDLARSEGNVIWALCPLEDRVLEIDAAAGEIVDQLELGDPRTAAVADDLWVGFEDGVAQVDTKTLEVIAVYGLYPRYGGAIFAGDDAVWVREEGHFLTHIDPAEQRIVEAIEAPKIHSGGDVLAIGDTVWATAYDDDVLVELRAR